MQLVDLSQPFFPGMRKAMYKADKSPELDFGLETIRSVETDGINLMKISFGNHVGTHLDGPRHVVPGGASLDELPLDTYYGTGVVVDIPKGQNGAITVADLESATPAIEERDIVLLHTGWAKPFGTTDYTEFHPYLTEDAATWLANKQVRMVGIDSTSVDLPKSLRTASFKHGTLRILLENKIPAIHNVANLASIVNRRVTVLALPLLIPGADGAASRVVAWVD